jgi:hypothetical protein
MQFKVNDEGEMMNIHEAKKVVLDYEKLKKGDFKYEAPQ